MNTLYKMFLMLCFIFCLDIGIAQEATPLCGYDQKIIAFYREHGHYTDHPGYPENHKYWEELRWFRAQGIKVRPGLVYLLENEYKGQWEKMSDVMSGLSQASGDKSDLVGHIRKNLPDLIGNEERQKDGYVHKSIRFLAQYGNATDLPLLEKFLNVEGELPQFHIRKSIQKLKTRLAKEKEHSKIWDGDRKPPSKKSGQVVTVVLGKSSIPTQTASAEETKIRSKWPVVLAIILAVVVLMFRIKLKSATVK